MSGGDPLVIRNAQPPTNWEDSGVLGDLALSEEDLLASICAESFYDFFVEFWDTVVQDPLEDNWHIRFLCDEMQEEALRVYRGEHKKHDTIINISPSTSKSTIVSVMFPAWVWAFFPEARFICASYTEALAIDLSRRCRDVIDSDKYHRIFPQRALRRDLRGVKAFGNTEGGLRYAVGTGGAVTGKHAHFILIDDPLNPNESASKAVLTATNEWMRSTIATRKVNKAVTPTFLIMQRLHQDDPTGNWLGDAKRAKTVRKICLPAELSPRVRPLKLRSKYKDGLMDPVRLSPEVLEEAKNSLGPYNYAGQFDQHPIPREGGLFKITKLRYSSEPPPDRKFDRLVRYWDKAGTKDGGCFTVGLKMGVIYERIPNGQGKTKKGRATWWVLDIVRGQWASNEREQIIRTTCEEDNRYVQVVTYVEQEGGSGGKESAEATINNCAGYVVKRDLPKGEKSIRADPLSVQVNNGNVVVVQAGWNQEFKEELEYFPESKNKDQVDAGSAAFAKLTNRKKIGPLR